MLNSILIQGFIFAIMSLGVYITYKILDFPDLSVDGTFPLGAAITAILIVKGVNPYITLLVSFLGGTIAGMITGIIHVKLKVRDLLAGIIMMTALYSINLRIAGKANVAFTTKDTIFTKSIFRELLRGVSGKTITLIVLVMIVLLLKIVIDFYLKTRAGYLLRAVGDNKTLVTTLGKDIGLVKIIGLSLANGLAALAGCIYAQEERYFDISMGTGMVVIGLASVIIGINVFERFDKIKPTTAVIAGTILYKACWALAIKKGLSANDLKLVTAVLFLIILVLTQEKKRKVNKNA
ncbi:putative ABC transport system permease protein [Lachnotalea glycerini]|uniref:ABC transporter permease n=1 Tax=Lachnotalea glycerini TaxID=1763509 RepID=A0A255I678_9FIRM|nr:ABC transporter permease [Lachnotalea glycerini]PXV93662.1 putative ABC transport system permease protein [Lachnotalea glycerini]RDY32608.1 ABC transporter permease [Lachnotalea glycerini]